MLPDAVSVEDYVVVKLEGQQPALAIGEALAHLPELSQLVREGIKCSLGAPKSRYMEQM